MRSFFCDKCNLEFDLDEDFDDDDDNTVFCPQCKINLAKILPETPERILMRAKRQQELRKKKLKARTRMLLVTFGILVLANLLMQIRPGSFFLMLRLFARVISIRHTRVWKPVNVTARYCLWKTTMRVRSIPLWTWLFRAIFL